MKMYSKEVLVVLDLDFTMFDTSACDQYGDYINGSMMRDDPSAWLYTMQKLKRILSGKGYTASFCVVTSKPGFDCICEQTLLRFNHILKERTPEPKSTFEKSNLFYTLYKENVIYDFKVENGQPYYAKLSEEDAPLNALNIATDLPKAAVMQRLAVRWNIDPNLVVLVDDQAADHKKAEQELLKQQQFQYVCAKKLYELSGGEENILERTQATIDILGSLETTVQELVNQDIAKRAQESKSILPKLTGQKNGSLFSDPDASKKENHCSQTDVKQTAVDSQKSGLKRKEQPKSEPESEFEAIERVVKPKKASTPHVVVKPKPSHYRLNAGIIGIKGDGIIARSHIRR